MSPGGGVQTWLTVAETLVGRTQALWVDRICASSCANYLVPVADQVHAIEGSLVIWHGGPGVIAQADADEATRDMLVEIERRTRDLYRKTGVTLGVMEATSRPPDETKALAAEFGANPFGPHIDGYAISPERLEECFTFSNVSSLWHPGGNRDVFHAGRALSRSLTVLEFPKAFRDKPESQIIAKRSETYWRCARFSSIECLKFKAKRFSVECGEASAPLSAEAVRTRR